MRLMLICLPLLLCLSACGGFIYRYERGAPKRISVEKMIEDGALVLDAERITPTTVEVYVGRSQHIKLTRRIVYSTIAVHHENQSVLWELFEVPFGALSMFLAPFMLWLEPWYQIPAATPEMIYNYNRVVLHRIFGFVNPFERVASDIRRDFTYPEEMFQSEPFQTQYEMRSPAHKTSITYVVEDLRGRVITQGEASADQLGTVHIEGLPTHWIRLHLTSGEMKREIVLPSKSISGE